MTGTRFSLNNEDFDLDDENDAVYGAMSAAHDSCLSVGDVLSYYSGETFSRKGSDFFHEKDVQCLYEMWEERAYDHHGEVAEGFSAVTPKADQELEGFLRYWMDKYMEPAFYGIRNVREIEFEVTQEMYDEFCA